MARKDYSRRKFLKHSAVTGVGAALVMDSVAAPLFATSSGGTPAILGGRPVRSDSWPEWPVWNPETDEDLVLKVLRSGTWSRAEVVAEFEKKWAETVGARRCLTVVNGTNALITALTQWDIGGGDEVIVPPYTFIATVQAVLQTGAMPVFVDTDPETFLIDADKIEEKITSRTRAILPVHIAGLPADMVRIMDIAQKHDLIVVEDACQAWLAEINHRQMGTFGHAGCFSFQNSKNIPMGEGGAVVSDDDAFMDRCGSYHNFGVRYGSVGEGSSGIVKLGTKLRLTEYQAAIGLAQLKRLESQTLTRNKNAPYLKGRLEEIPGILPYRLHDNVTRAAFHLFPFRYKKEKFSGLPRELFLKALRAEGVPCSHGYDTLNDMPYLKNTFQTKNFKRMYPEERLDFDKYLAENQCPENDRLCREEAVWFTQNLLLGDRSDMDDIARAIEKIRKSAEKIKKHHDK